MLGFNDHEVGDPVRVAAAQESVWLKALYESNRELIHGDIDRSWRVLQIFVPVALAPFAGVATVDRITVPRVVLLAAISCLALSSANLFVDRIKRHEKRSWFLIRAIEAEIGLSDLGTGWRLGPPIRGGLRFRVIRWSLQLSVLMVWLILVIAVGLSG